MPTSDFLPKRLRKQRPSCQPEGAPHHDLYFLVRCSLILSFSLTHLPAPLSASLSLFGLSTLT